MVEYGNGISHGPAGQVSGTGGTHAVTQHTDFFGSVGQAADGAFHTLGTLTPIELVGLVAIFFVGLIVLRRVFF
jgi:hypothetical protein